MAALVPATTEEHVLIAKNVTSRYIKGKADLTLRRRLIHRKLKEAGRISLGRTGHSQTWSAEVRQAPVRTMTDNGTIVFGPTDRNEQLTLGHRALIVTDRLTDMKREQMSGPEAIVRYYDEMLPALMKDMGDAMNESLFIDGYHADNEGRYHGVESFMGSSTTVAADLIAKPSDSYAGQSTALGSLAGSSWSNDESVFPNASVARDWPNGSGTSSYDAFTPTLVNESSTSWGTGEPDWINNCEECIRFVVTRMGALGALDTEKDQIPMIFLHTAKKLAQLKSYLSARNFHPVPYKEGQEFGHTGTTIMFEGAVHDTDYNVPANTSYGFAIPKMELYSVRSELFRSNVFHDPNEEATKALVRTHGNYRFQPKCFAKIYPYA